jgi:TadE-like protein
VSIRRDQEPKPALQAGQASVELVAVLPLLLVALLAVGQLAVAGYALWSAGAAARSGARAAHVGGSPEEAARSALPEPLRSSAQVTGRGPVEVRVEAPALLPGLSPIALTARAQLGPDSGGG